MVLAFDHPLKAIRILAERRVTRPVVFLGNEEKVFVIYVEQSVGSGDRAVQARHAKGATAHFRTRKSRDHWKRQLGKTVELGDRSQEG